MSYAPGPNLTLRQDRITTDVVFRTAKHAGARANVPLVTVATIRRYLGARLDI
jgi:hypothetical protein